MKILLIIFLSIFTLYATQAIQKELEFKQPDGTTFKGYLRGDSALHWIESSGEIIVYNPKDKYYYKANIDTVNAKLTPSTQKFMPTLLQRTALNQKQTVKKVSDAKRASLKSLYKKIKATNAPR
ncbi:hypothetical protein [Sulfurimonas sp.]